VKGTAAREVGGFPAVVTLEPVGGSSAALPDASPVASGTPEPAYMDQIAIAFYPPTLLTQVGRPVLFANGENLMHNVNVGRDGADAVVFNVVTPPGFEPYRHIFTQPGVYRVACNIHPGMSAFIVVVATPYAAVADRDGGYAIHEVQPGSYRAAVWSVDPALRAERAVEITRGGSIVTLDLAPEPAAE
jgi:plastocyanin